MVHKAHIQWWRDTTTGLPIQRNKKELLSLVISEICEALEGERKNLMDDKLPTRKMAEVEMADTLIRLLDFCGGFCVHLRMVNLFPEDVPPTNKGEALFNLIHIVVRYERSNYQSSNLWDAIAYIKAYCMMHGYDLEGALYEKLSYNATRADHTPEARCEVNGKKF